MPNVGYSMGGTLDRLESVSEVEWVQDPFLIALLDATVERNQAVIEEP